MLFATLFASYLVLAGRTADGPTPAQLFELKTLLIQTLLLLTSSFTCGIVIHEMRKHNQKAMLGWFVLTLLLGAGFLFFEIEEFIMYIGEGATIQTSAFLSGFFCSSWNARSPRNRRYHLGNLCYYPNFKTRFNTSYSS